MPSVNGAAQAARHAQFSVPVQIADTVYSQYADVAASQTAQVLGAAGAIGDFIDGVLVVPETLAAGTIALLDGSGSRNIFIAGTLADLKPFYVKVGAKSLTGAWKLTTGANVHAICFGKFTS